MVTSRHRLPHSISGETFWYVSNGVSKPFFAALLALFAREAGAGRARMIVLGLDSAGWHTEPNLVVPDGIRLAYLPPYSPELQPAEHLWPVLDEPLANQYFETLADLERAVAERCLGFHRATCLCPGSGQGPTTARAQQLGCWVGVTEPAGQPCRQRSSNSWKLYSIRTRPDLRSDGVNG